MSRGFLFFNSGLQKTDDSYPLQINGLDKSINHSSHPSRREVVVRVRLTHLSGSLANLAPMKLAHWHRSQVDDVYFKASENTP